MLKISDVSEFKHGDIVKFEDSSAWWMFEIFEKTETMWRGQLIDYNWPGHILTLGDTFRFNNSWLATGTFTVLNR